MMANDLVAVARRALTPAQFGDLADVPSELEWLANITNPKTRRAYKNDVGEFSAFAGLRQSAELRSITRAHVIAWRKHLESRALAPASIRRRPWPSRFISPFAARIPRDCHMPLLSSWRKGRPLVSEGSARQQIKALRSSHPGSIGGATSRVREVQIGAVNRVAKR
jgi:hypothetical protein